MSYSLPRPTSIGQTVTRPIRVILVEDDDDLRHTLTDFLRLNHFSVTPVATGRDFKIALVTDQFDVAVVDINLPDVEGFEICQSLTQSSSVGVIILTARSVREDKIKGYSAGANLYLTKPADGEELVLAINNLSRRPRAQPLATKRLPSAGWKLDRAAQCLTTPDGILIKLSGREAKLILTLAECIEGPLSREVLAAAIGYTAGSHQARSFDAVLRRLRSKCRDVQVEIPIHAVHSAGLQFSAEIVIV